MKFAFLKNGDTFKKPHGRKVYTKIGSRAAIDEKGNTEVFNTRDIVEPTMVKTKAMHPVIEEDLPSVGFSVEDSPHVAFPHVEESDEGSTL